PGGRVVPTSGPHGDVRGKVAPRVEIFLRTTRRSVRFDVPRVPRSVEVVVQMLHRDLEVDLTVIRAGLQFCYGLGQFVQGLAQVEAYPILVHSLRPSRWTTSEPRGSLAVRVPRAFPGPAVPPVRAHRERPPRPEPPRRPT